ncbi:MAG: cytidylate kinase [Armatimonadetes bacterium JP3_11]|jgi:cytidylate kinase|nr:MAG: cytidylate kinase [Armatimonadetes bacterium CP1_7O]OYT74430.1 MAG: cytidylate kinase [Armatimonadetes bacterium JP3_11]
MTIIAIDGPAGSGKSTLAKNLARALGFVFLDTGAMYRALALAAQRAGIAPDDEARLTELAHQITLRFVAQNDSQRVLLGDEDVSDAIRTPEISDLASRISVYSGVRRAMVALQRALAAQAHGVVAEGRDTTTVVFPNATLKIYLDASPQERARRRQHQLQLQGIEEPYEKVLQEILERDARDLARADSPLRIAPDAVVVQNDGWTKEQTFEHVLALCRERLGQA